MLPIKDHVITSPNGSSIYYQGFDLNTGTQPAVLFFALSAQMSLFVDPFNQSVLRLNQHGIRVFSWDLPFHGPHEDPHQAMHQWAKAFTSNASFLRDFLSLCQENIQYLIKQNLINIHQFAVAGLSRGGFIATHLAALEPEIKSILGFSPLTKPQPLEEFMIHSGTSFDPISLQFLVNQLVHKHLRFYIGNRDTRVGTDTCYQLIRTLTEAAFTQGIRSPTVELMIYPSIGHKGHGTPSYIFEDGADWLKRQLLA